MNFSGIRVYRLFKGIVHHSSFIVVFVLASCGGDTTNSTQSTTTKEVKDTSPFLAGKTIYQKTCLPCHQSDGKGMQGTYPPLAGSDYLLADKFRAIHQVLKGSMNRITVNGSDYQGVMTPQPLNDSDVAAVLNYAYHSFGNNGFMVSPSDVKSVRDTIK